MIRDTFNLPTTRTWRDIPQPVVPRAMSREGRWRLVMATLRIAALAVILAVFAWGAWLVAMSIRENTRAMPAAAKTTPMKRPELRTDGVLDEEWLVQTLALPANASLVELDLDQLRAKLLADDQVVNATLTKHFPDRLVVQLTERSPVVRVMTRFLGQEHALLVARDGVIYRGQGYDPALLETLPWLDGVTIGSDGGRFQPVDGMTVASELLAKARLEAEHLYGAWNVISLKRLESDHKLEIRTKDGSVVYFTTNDDFFRQLAKLDYIVEKLAAVPGAKAIIDLSLTGDAGYGHDVPVTVIPPPDTDPATVKPGRSPVPARTDLAPDAAFRTPATALPATDQTFFALRHAQPRKTQREF